MNFLCLGETRTCVGQPILLSTMFLSDSLNNPQMALIPQCNGFSVRQFYNICRKTD